VRLRELLDIPELRLVLRTDTGSLDRPIRWVYVTELLDPARYLTGNELVLTGLMWHRRPEDSDRFAATAAAAGVSAVGAGTAVHGAVPADFVRACRRYRLPLVEVPIEVSFGTVSEVVTRRLSAERANGLATALGRHRRLVGAAAEGEGLGPVFALARRDLGINCWVLSATGRVVSGDGAPPEGRTRELAAGFRGAERLPCVVASGAPFTLVPVDTRSQHRMAGWFLACEGVLAEREPEVRESVDELATLAALEWARIEEGRRVERRLAGRLVELALEGEPTAVAAQMRTCGMSPREPFAVVAAEVRGAEPAASAAALDELLDGVSGEGPRVPVAVLDGVVAVGLVPLGSPRPHAGDGSRGGAGNGAWGEMGNGSRGEMGNGAADGGTNAGDGRTGAAAAGQPASGGHPEGAEIDGPVSHPDAETLVRLLRRRLGDPVPAASRTAGAAGAARPAPGAAYDIAVGVSGPAPGSDALRAAIEEARHACRLATMRPGPAHVVTSDEIHSHAMLLASVPEGVRRLFRERLLGPLRDYDRRHGSDLMATLRAFLDCSGSWNKCAAALHIHVNTLRYRIRRIEELTGRDLGSLETRVDFFLALEAT
jgi:hypothetical protein